VCTYTVLCAIDVLNYDLRTVRHAADLPERKYCETRGVSVDTADSENHTKNKYTLRAKWKLLQC
jgi:hypothetical protein